VQNTDLWIIFETVEETSQYLSLPVSTELVHFEHMLFTTFSVIHLVSSLQEHHHYNNIKGSPLFDFHSIKVTKLTQK
jgi:hypothetical protein